MFKQCNPKCLDSVKAPKMKLTVSFYFSSSRCRLYKTSFHFHNALRTLLFLVCWLWIPQDGLFVLCLRQPSPPPHLHLLHFIIFSSSPPLPLRTVEEFIHTTRTSSSWRDLANVTIARLINGHFLQALQWGLNSTGLAAASVASFILRRWGQTFTR